MAWQRAHHFMQKGAFLGDGLFSPRERTWHRCSEKGKTRRSDLFPIGWSREVGVGGVTHWVVQTRRIHSCHGQVQAVDLFEEEDEGGDKEHDDDRDDSDHTDLALLISYLYLKYDMIMVLLLILTKPHTPYSDLKYAIMMMINRIRMLIFMMTVPHPVSRLEVCHGRLRAAARREGGEGQLVVSRQPESKLR